MKALHVTFRYPWFLRLRVEYRGIVIVMHVDNVSLQSKPSIHQLERKATVFPETSALAEEVLR